MRRHDPRKTPAIHPGFPAGRKVRTTRPQRRSSRGGEQPEGGGAGEREAVEVVSKGETSGEVSLLPSGTRSALSARASAPVLVHPSLEEPGQLARHLPLCARIRDLRLPVARCLPSCLEYHRRNRKSMSRAVDRRFDRHDRQEPCLDLPQRGRHMYSKVCPFRSRRAQRSTWIPDRSERVTPRR